MPAPTDPSRISRPFWRAPLNDIPTGSTIQSATLSMWHYETAPAADTLHAYRLTHDWAEGSSDSSTGACTGDGVTWYEANGGIAWAAQGGDFATGSSHQSAPVTLAAREAPPWAPLKITPNLPPRGSGPAPKHCV